MNEMMLDSAIISELNDKLQEADELNTKLQSQIDGVKEYCKNKINDHTEFESYKTIPRIILSKLEEVGK